jgi:hypothetical protein
MHTPDSQSRKLAADQNKDAVEFLESTDFLPKLDVANHAKPRMSRRRSTCSMLPTTIDTARLNRGMRAAGFDSLVLTPVELKSCINFAYNDFDLLNEFNIDQKTFTNFVNAVFTNYHDVVFHNIFHGFTCMQVTFVMLQGMPVFDIFQPLGILAALTASLCHDIDHP